MQAQELEDLRLDSTLLGNGAYITIDSIVISAKRKGFDVESFINHILNDESFYFAFKNLRRTQYTFDMHTRFYDKKEILKAEYFGIHNQVIEDTCQTMHTTYEYVEGDFYKKEKQYNYYTSKLLARAFFTRGKRCFHASDTLMDFSAKTNSQLENQITQLKRVIFTPGKATGLPVLGDKMAIFKEKMRKYYDYSLGVEDYKEFGDCYVFKIDVKDYYKKKKKGKTVIKHMYTYFEKKTLQVLGREYRVKHGLPLYSFDMTLDVVLTKKENRYIPKSIQVDGYWDLIARKPEILDTEIFIYNVK